MNPIPRIAGALILAAGGAVAATAWEETTLWYRLRGEVRPLLFWVGRDEVGGGRISIRRAHVSSVESRNEIEVLFGSAPERIPGRINRWGYGRESAVWTSGPSLLTTEFQGLMRHSPESSIRDVRSDSTSLPAFDVTRSVVSAEQAWHELRTFTDPQDFSFRDPERLLVRYRAALANSPPLHTERLPRGSYAEPYGFLTALSRLIQGAVNDGLRSGRLTFVFNANPYLLELAGVREIRSFRYAAGQTASVAVLDFRTFNTVRRTRSAFTIWTPLTGDLKGLPVRIAYQPRWWLRLRLDLDRMERR